MSVNAMAQIWGADLPASEKLILLSLADHADHNGEHIYPSKGLIAWKTGFDPRHVNRVLKNLEDKKILVRTGVRTNRVIEYKIIFSTIPRLAPYEGINHLARDKDASTGCDSMSQHDSSYDSMPQPENYDSMPEPVASYDTESQHGSKKGDSSYDTVPQLDGQVMTPETSSCDSAESYKPLINHPLIVDDVESTTTIKNSGELVKKRLLDMGLHPRKINQLTSLMPSDTILTWLELYPGVKQLGLAGKPDWIYTACWFGWNPRIVQDWLNNPPGKLPDFILSALDQFGWVGPTDEIVYYYHADPERLENWLSYLTENKNSSITNPAGILRESLRNGIAAPRHGRFENNYQRYADGEYADFIEH